MKKTLSLLLFFVLASPPLVFGGLSDKERSLKGIGGFDVLVEDFDTESERARFPREEYKNAVELRLRSLGIPIDESSSSYLYLNINPIRVTDNVFALSIERLASVR